MNASLKSWILGARGKATLFVVGCTTAALVAAGSWIAGRSAVVIRAELQHSAQSLAASLGRSCELHLAVGNTIELERVAGLYMKDPEICWIEIRSSNDRILTRVSKEAKGPARDHTLHSGEIILVSEPVHMSDQDRDAALVDNPEESEEGPSGTLGTVTVGMSARSAHLAQQSMVRSIGLVVAILALLIVPFVIWAVGRWARRLRGVVEASRKIADGDLGFELHVETDDEIGQLGRSFESMRLALREREESLLTVQQLLQEEVLEKTRARDEAVAANEAKSEFLANMSHELRTPMHGILSFAALALEGTEKGSYQKLPRYLGRIVSSGERLTDLLNDLLDLAKLEAGRVQLEPEHRDLVPIVRSVIDEFSSLLSQQEKTVQFESVRSCACDFDANRIMQVVRNLLSNALKFSPTGGVVTVAVLCEDAFARVTVEDGGVGIPAEELEDVFDKFVQSSKTKSGAGGTGLGLAICREIVNGHGGRIWAENRAQGGARFTFVLPLKTRSRSADEGEHGAGATPDETKSDEVVMS